MDRYNDNALRGEVLILKFPESAIYLMCCMTSLDEALISKGQ